MKTLCIRNGMLYLDGEKVDCLKDYKIVSSAKSAGIAELTIAMDVAIGLIDAESGR